MKKNLKKSMKLKKSLQILKRGNYMMLIENEDLLEILEVLGNEMFFFNKEVLM
jgi:hypothetical protein